MFVWGAKWQRACECVCFALPRGPRRARCIGWNGGCLPDTFTPRMLSRPGRTELKADCPWLCHPGLPSWTFVPEDKHRVAPNPHTSITEPWCVGQTWRGARSTSETGSRHFTSSLGTASTPRHPSSSSLWPMGRLQVAFGIWLGDSSLGVCLDHRPQCVRRRGSLLNDRGWGDGGVTRSRVG